MEIALNSDTPGGFSHENAIASQNGLALLASITLKNALNINNNNNSSAKNNITQHNSNILNFNQNKNKITHHKASQPQNGFVSSPTIASSSLSSSASVAENVSLTNSNHTTIMQQTILSEQKNVFTFTTEGLQALTATALTTIENETRAKSISVDQQQGQTNTAFSSKNNSNKNNHHISLSTNHQQHQITNNKTLSAKDPTVALLEALSIKTNKKQQSVSTQQQEISSSSSTISKSAQSFVATNGNNVNINNNNGSGNGISNRNGYRIPSDILDDLASRFIINVPDMELSNLIRICFQIELAHWFYLDFFCASDEEKKLQPCGIKQFALQIFEHIPFLRQHLSSIDKILEDWKNYKLSVPTYGAILISEDLNYCLLVQSYFAKSSWGFPKGKVNENEDPVHCATREVYEETGYDITELIVPNDFIEAVINYQYTRLYIVRDVSLETKFSPRTRNEIKCCDWFPIDSLPANKNEAISKPKLGRSANSFFMIMPFVKRLKKWVNDKRNGVETRRKYSSGSSPTASTSPLTTTNAIMINGQQVKTSCKKQQKRNNSNNFIDEINALNNVGGGAATAALTTSSCGNNANINCSNSTSNANRSTRQRHKSMGDLDVIKLNNCNNQSNCKATNNHNNNSNNNNCGSITSPGTTASNSGGNLNCNNITTNNNNQKRNSKIVAAGSNVSNTNNGCNTNNNSNSSSKRQLFHSQSQTHNLQQNGEKIVSSFDLIRKEKQQMKAALAKAHKQQQNLNNNNGRQRAKSQSDKMCLQQQKSSVNVGNNKQQQRLQKQQSLIATNTNMQSNNVSNNNHHNNINSNNNNNNTNKNNINSKTDVNNSLTNKLTIGGFKTPTPPPLCGKDLLALAAAAAAATSVIHTTTMTPSQVSKIDICDQQQLQQKARPSSVSLHFPEVSSYKNETITTGDQMPQLTRMASGTNLRILKRSTSHQSTQQQQKVQPQPPQRQASALQFTPSFNSWTNFTFTKNFIANVFC